MVDYTNVISVGAELLTIIIIGYICAKLKIVTDKDTSQIGKIVFFFGLSPLVARSIVVRKFSTLNFFPMLVSALMSIVSYILMTPVFLLHLKDTMRTYLSTILPIVYINYVISGIPIFNAIWDSSENVLSIMMTMANDLVAGPIYLLLVGVYNEKKNSVSNQGDGESSSLCSLKSIWPIVKKAISSPILIGTCCGIIYCAIGLNVPTALTLILKYFGDISVPLSLFNIGVFLAGHSLLSTTWYQLFTCLIMRSFIGPAFAGLFAKAFGLSNRMCRQCIIIGAQPTAVASYVFAQNAGGIGMGTASTLILWSTVIEVPVIIIWFQILDALKLFVD